MDSFLQSLLHKSGNSAVKRCKDIKSNRGQRQVNTWLLQENVTQKRNMALDPPRSPSEIVELYGWSSENSSRLDIFDSTVG